MINWNLNEIVYAIYNLTKFRSEMEERLEREGDDAHMTSHLVDSYKYMNGFVFKPLEKLDISTDRIKSIRFYLEFYGSYKDIAHELRALESDITSAAKNEWFYHYPKDKVALIFAIDENWPSTIVAFPSAKRDVFAATDCYALGHFNASIYHSMMILERGLPAFAKRLKVKVKPRKDSWGPIIEDIRKEIDNRQKNMTQPPKGTKPISSRALGKNHKSVLGSLPDSSNGVPVFRRCLAESYRAWSRRL